VAAISLQKPPTAAAGDPDGALPTPESDEVPIADRIAAVHFGSALSDTQRVELEDLVREYEDVVTNVLRETTWAEMRLQTDGANPAFVHQYPLSRHEQEQQRKEVQRMVELGVMERVAHSLWNAPQLLVEKKPLPDGAGGMLPPKWRVVADFRKLNDALSFSESFPLPHIPSVLSSLSGCKWYSATDALHGYWAVPIAAEDRHKTAISVTAASGGAERYQYKRMAMGLKPAAAIYQAMMTRVCADIPGCRPYLDDCLLGHASFEEHAHALRQLFEACRRAGISLKPEKIYLGHDSVKYLGMDINADGVALDEAYVQALREKSAPTCLKEAQRLAGACNWCRDHCVGFAEKMGPIYAATKPGTKWVKSGHNASWGTAQEEARLAVMEALERRIRLAHPSQGGKMVLVSDASKEAVGAVLMEERVGADGKIERVPLGVFSQKLSAAQQQYAPTSLEAYAVIAALRRFRHFLHGPRPFDVVTDHASLQHVTGAPHKSGQLCRWKSIMLEYNMNIVPRKGSDGDIVFADYWSRPPFGANVNEAAPQHEFLDALDHTEAFMAAAADKRTALDSIARAAPVRATRRQAWGLAEAQQDDLICKAVRERVAGASASTVAANLSQAQASFVEQVVPAAHEDENGALCTRSKEGAVVALLPLALRAECLAAFHDAVGHPMGRTTHERVRAAFVWPLQRRDTLAWVASCTRCRGRTPSSRGAHAAAEHIPDPPCNFHTWFADVSGPFTLREPTSKGKQKKGTKTAKKRAGESGDSDETGQKRYNLSFMCARSRWVECCVIEKGVTAEACIKAFIGDIVRRFSMPACVVTDNGSEFRGEFESTLADMNIQHRTASAYGTHTGTSIVERWHRSMWQRLATTIPHDVTDWRATIKGAAAHYNMTPQSEHGVAPFTACFHQRPVGEWEASWRPESSGALPSAQSLLLRRANDRAARQARRMQQRAHGSKAEFAVGDAVWCYQPAAPSPSTRKLLSSYVPAVVREVVSPQSYVVQLVDSSGRSQRKIDDLRGRTSRTDLLAVWECEPPNLDREEPGWDAVNQNGDEPSPELRATATPRAKAGMRVVVGAAMPGLATLPAIYDGRSVACAGVVTRVTNGKAHVRWICNAEGKSPGSTVQPLEAGKFKGVCTRFHPGSFADGEWAVFEGPDLEQHPILAAIVGRRAKRDFTGRSRTDFVARQLGVLPDLDVIGTEDEMAARFPAQARAMMQRFVDTCFPI
jgi:hypothetical protein